MHSKTCSAAILLSRRYTPLRLPTSNPNSILSPLPSHLNSAPTSQNEISTPDNHFPFSTNRSEHFTHTGHVLPRPRQIISYCKAQSLRFFGASSQIFCRTPGMAQTPGRLSSMSQLSRSSMPCNLGMECEKLDDIIKVISGDADGMESSLSNLSFRLSPTRVAEVLRVLNDRGLSALRFLEWVLNSPTGFKPNSEIYNLIVDNLGRLEDYKTMCNVLTELSYKGICLTEKAFTFVKFCSPSTIKDSVRRLMEVLNGIRGSCRGSGIYSLIKLLCLMHNFEIAFLVMDETIRRTSYYNVLIAAKCRNGDFMDALGFLDEMRIHGCDPNTKSFNYLLGSLFKNKRIFEACKLLQSMEEAGYVPDLITYEVVTSHACKANRMDYAIEILNKMLSEGLKPRLTTHAAFVKGFFLSGQVHKAYNYVIEMSVKDKCSSNLNYSLLANLFQLSGRIEEAGKVLCEMMEKGLKPNFSVYIKVLTKLHKMSRGDLSSELKSMFLKFNTAVDAG